MSNKKRLVRDTTVADRGIEEGDYLILRKLQDHYVLPSHYIHSLIKHVRKDRMHNLARLRYLFDAGYIERPVEMNDPRALADHACYSLGDKKHRCWKALAARGDVAIYSQPAGGGYKHNFGTCAVTANIDIGATRAGYRYISQEEILRKAPEKTRGQKNPLAIPTEISYLFKTGTETSNLPTVPDQLFGIEYPTGVIFYLVEFDRASETLRPQHFKTKNQHVNSILRKMLAYRNILQTGAAIRHFLDLPKGAKAPDFKVLFVTTGETSESAEARCNSMVGLAEELYPTGSYHLLFNWIPGFKPYLGTPPLLPRLWDEPWIRPRREPFAINKV